MNRVSSDWFMNDNKNDKNDNKQLCLDSLPKVGDLLTLSIVDSNLEGDGIAKAVVGSGKKSEVITIIVKKALTGDVVEAKIVEFKKTYYEAVITNIIEKSELRITSACEYYENCGGCQHLHINKDYRRQLKLEHLKNEIEHHTGYTVSYDESNLSNSIQGVVPVEFFGSDDSSRIRATLTIENGKIAFYKEKSNTPILIDKCYMLTDKLNEHIKFILSDERIKSLIAQKEYKKLSVLTNNIETSFELRHKTQQEAFEDGNSNDENKDVTAGVVKSDGSIEFTKPIDGNAIKFQSGNYSAVYASSSAFFQSNIMLIPKLQDIIAGQIKDDVNVIEHYAGSGLLTVAIATKTDKLIASEIAPTSIKLARLGGVSQIVATSAEKFMPQKRSVADTIVIDPPRVGLSSTMLKKIMNDPPRKIVYVSCSLYSFTRDVKKMQQKLYKLEKIYMLDMYPTSKHIELVGILTIW